MSLSANEELPKLICDALGLKNCYELTLRFAVDEIAVVEAKFHPDKEDLQSRDLPNMFAKYELVRKELEYENWVAQSVHDSRYYYKSTNTEGWNRFTDNILSAKQFFEEGAIKFCRKNPDFKPVERQIKTP